MSDVNQMTFIVPGEKIAELRKLRITAGTATLADLVVSILFAEENWQTYVLLTELKQRLRVANFNDFVLLSIHTQKDSRLEIAVAECFLAFCDRSSLNDLVQWYKVTYNAKDFEWINYELFVAISRRVEILPLTLEPPWFSKLVTRIVTANDGHESLVALFYAKYIALAEERDRAARDPS